MVLGILKPILTPILNPLASVIAPTSATSNATQQTAAQQTAAQQDPQSAQPEGVKFDLSDKALQLVEDAAAQSPATPPALQAPAALPPAAAASAPPRTVTASTESTAKPGPETSGTTDAEPADAADPTEEERARAWAIRGMEREKLLDLVETLKVTPKADTAEKEVAESTVAQPYVQAAPIRDTTSAV